MKRKLLLLTLLLSAFLLLPKESAVAGPSDICNDYEWDMLKIVNEQRLRYEIEPVSVYPILQEAAAVRVEEVIGKFSHDRPDNRDFSSVLDDKNIQWTASAENIATGSKTPAIAMEKLMDSFGHQQNILNYKYAHIGIGYRTQGIYGPSWEQLFVGECEAKSIDICGPITETEAGMTIDDMGLYLEITCSSDNHGKSYCPIIAQMCTGYSAEKTCEQTVTVTYQGLQRTFTVKAKTEEKKEYEEQEEPKEPEEPEEPVVPVKPVEPVNPVEPVDPVEPVEPVEPVKPKISKTSIKTVISRKKGRITITWKPVKNCDGYEICYSTQSNFKKAKKVTIKKRTIKSYTIKNLKPKKKYYVKIRTYRKSESGKKYSAYSKKKSVRVK